MNMILILIMVEINLMTALYLSLIAVTADRLLCVLLQGKYSTHLTKRIIKITIAFIWITSNISGLVMRAIFPTIHPLHASRMYYYLVWDILAVVFIVSTYSVVINMIRKGACGSRINKNSSSNSNGNSRCLVLGVLLTASFIVFNLVPDVVMMVCSDSDDTTYYVIALMWSTGYLVDPLIYIFSSKDSRSIARSSLTDTTSRFVEKLSQISFRNHSNNKRSSGADIALKNLNDLNAEEV